MTLSPNEIEVAAAELVGAMTETRPPKPVHGLDEVFGALLGSPNAELILSGEFCRRFGAAVISQIASPATRAMLRDLANNLLETLESRGVSSITAERAIVPVVVYHAVAFIMNEKLLAASNAAERAEV